MARGSGWTGTSGTLPELASFPQSQTNPKPPFRNHAVLLLPSSCCISRAKDVAVRFSSIIRLSGATPGYSKPHPIHLLVVFRFPSRDSSLEYQLPRNVGPPGTSNHLVAVYTHFFPWGQDFPSDYRCSVQKGYPCHSWGSRPTTQCTP